MKHLCSIPHFRIIPVVGELMKSVNFVNTSFVNGFEFELNLNFINLYSAPIVIKTTF